MADPLVEHFLLTQVLAWLGVGAARTAWEKDAGSAGATMVPFMAALQLLAAESGATYVGPTLALKNQYVEPEWQVDPTGFPGWANSGLPMSDLLEFPNSRRTALLARGIDDETANRAGLASLERIVRTNVADTAGDAAAVDMAARPKVGYIRMVQPGACDRCIVLAGRFYYVNADFERHPNCNCFGEATTFVDDASAQRYAIARQRELFDGLGEELQDRRFGRAAAEAIRAGGDIGQVVNERRGRSVASTYQRTLADGTVQTVRVSDTRRGTREGTVSGWATGSVGVGGRRETVPELLRRAGDDRELLQRLLGENGYIVTRDEGGFLTSRPAAPRNQPVEQPSYPASSPLMDALRQAVANQRR